VLTPAWHFHDDALEVPSSAVAVRAARGDLPALLRVERETRDGARVRAPRGAAQRPVGGVEHAKATARVADADQRGVSRERRDGGTALNEGVFRV
jgi:hypothetical protein